MKPKFRIARHVAILSAIAFTASAQGANLTWDTASGDGASITADGGNWDTSTVTWNDSGSNVAWSQTNATTATNAAIFAGADGIEGAYPVSVTTAIAAQSLAFNNTGYALSAAAARTININSTTSPITVASTKSATIGTNVTAFFSATGSPSNITGGGTLKISGTGATVSKPSNLLNIIGGTTVNVGTSGLLTTSSQFLIGTSAGTGTVVVDGGTVSSTSTTNNHNLILANVASANTTSGTLTINSGTVTHPAVSGGLRFGSGSPLTAPNTATGTLNLNGGQLTVARLYEGNIDPGINSTVNFNGGRLIVRTGATNAANFMTGLDAANVLAGGAIIDTNGVETTIGQALLGTGGGGLTKEGNGLLNLTGANTYTGATTINGGKIGITAPYNALTATTINANARLRVTTGATASSISSVTVNTNSGIETNVGAHTIGQLEGLSVTNFNANGDYKIDLVGTGIPTGDITVLTYTNKTGTGLPSLGTKPISIIGTVEDTGSAIVIHAQLAQIWAAGTGDWDTTSSNWTGMGPIYADGNTVVFPEITGTNTVTLTADRSPSAVVIGNDSTSTYTFAGSAIAGAASLSKAGSGVATLTATNSYTGATTISSGGLIVSANGALGSTAGSTTIVGNGSTTSGGALGLKNGVTYSTAEPIIGSGIANTALLGEFASVQRGFVQAISGDCTFAGPIQINATGVSRFGTQDGADLTLSGGITLASGVTGVTVLFRPGVGGDWVTVSGTGSNWDAETQIFLSTTNTNPGGVRLGADDALSTIAPLRTNGISTGVGTSLDLNGYDQTVAGLSQSNGRLIITNLLADSISVLTLNPIIDRNTFNTTTLTTIEDGAGKVAVVKTGLQKQTLHGTHTYTGSTTILGGMLALTSTATIDNTISMSIAAGAAFDVTAKTTYAIPATTPVTFKLDGTDTGSGGKIIASGLDITSAAVTIDPVSALDDSVYILAEYTAASLTGNQFASVTGLPSGYSINYAYDGGTKIALVQNPVAGFSSWVTKPEFNLAPADQDSSDDPDNDGMENLLEFALNGNPSVSDSNILPVLSVTSTHFEFTYQRRDDSVAPETTQTFQWGTTLASWPGSVSVSPAVASPNATVTVTPGSPDDNVTDTVKISIPKTEDGGAGKLFGRLQVVK